MNNNNSSTGPVGIENIGVYAGRAYIDVKKIADARGLDNDRFNNLLLKQKSVPLPFEDPVSFAVNAAKPVVDALTAVEKKSIELLIVATESGLDFGKPISTYVHHYLALPRNCRGFEIKHACYGGTAALQMAMKSVSPTGKALVICTDLARPTPHGYAKLSQGAASVALLVSHKPAFLEIDKMSGVYGYEVMDTFRPTPEIEMGDNDLSLLTYLECLEQSFINYQSKMENISYDHSFSTLSFHTPFGGMVRGAHRMMMRKLHYSPDQIEADFKRRVEASLFYCSRVGNIYSGSVFLALCGTIAMGEFSTPQRLGIFSYGSGCCSEFYSGVATKISQELIGKRNIQEQLDARYSLDMNQDEALLNAQHELLKNNKEWSLENTSFKEIFKSHFENEKLLVLKNITNYHREYLWS